MKYGIPIHLRSSFKDVPGTIVGAEDDSFEAVVVTGIACDKNEVKVTLRDLPNKPGIVARVFGSLADVTPAEIAHAKQVDVTLTGALLAVEQARTTLIPVVKLAPDAKPREVEITVEGVPAGIGVKVSPEHARLVPAKPVSPSLPARTP